MLASEQRLTRRQVYRRRRITVFGGLALVLAGAFYLPLTLLAPIAETTASISPWTAPSNPAAQPELPIEGASGIGAVGIPGLLAHAGSSAPRPIASITKIITALVVLDAKPLSGSESGPMIEFTAADVAIYSRYLAELGKVVPVYAGERLSERDVLKVMLVGSANNYARALADWAFGSQDKYLVAARAWLAAHHLDSTRLGDSTGLDPRDVSTPGDLVSLGKLALAHPIVAAIVSRKAVAIPGVGHLSNTNTLLGVAGIDGIKTGTLDEAGACLLFSATRTIGSHSVTIVGVVLGGTDHPSVNAHVRTMLKGVVAGFHEVTLATADQSFASYRTAWGGTAHAVAASRTTELVWADTAVGARVDAAPAGVESAGSRVGSVSFSIGDRTVTVPLRLDESIDDPGPWWRLTHPAELF